jgi:hypothetical protein
MALVTVEHFDNLKAQVEALEKKVGDADHIRARSITLADPGGGPTITLMANKYVSGIWISGETEEAPSVAIYVQPTEGAVVGIWGDYSDGRKREAIDICMVSSKAWGTQVQVVDSNHMIHEISADQLAELA